MYGVFTCSHRWSCGGFVSVYGRSANFQEIIMDVQSVVHFYGTKDLVKCHDFYVNKLGFSLYKDQGVCHIYQLTDTSFIGFCEHIPVAAQERSLIITLVVHDVWSVYHAWRSWMVIHEPTISQTFKIEHFFTLDPNGYTLEVQRFL